MGGHHGQHRLLNQPPCPPLLDPRPLARLWLGRPRVPRTPPERSMSAADTYRREERRSSRGVITATRQCPPEAMARHRQEVFVYPVADWRTTYRGDRPPIRALRTTHLKTEVVVQHFAHLGWSLAPRHDPIEEIWRLLPTYSRTQHVRALGAMQSPASARSAEQPEPGADG